MSARATTLVALGLLAASCGARTGFDIDAPSDAGDATGDANVPADAAIDQFTDSGAPLDAFSDSGTPEVAPPDALADVVSPIDAPADVTPDAGCGTVAYGPEVVFPVGCFVFTVAIADVDLDGLQDLLVTDESPSAGPDSLGVLRNLGGRVFAPESSFPTEPEVTGLAVADMNGDGWPDVVTLNQLNSSIGVFLNDHTGKFGVQVTYPAGNGPDGGPDWAWTLAVADLDGDLRPDVVVGEVDLTTQMLTGGGVGVRLNLGGGTLGPEVIYPNAVLAGPMGGLQHGWPISIAVADLNGDGAPDIAITSTDSYAAVYLNQGGGTFAPEARYPVGNSSTSGNVNVKVAIGDLDGNGRPDLVVTDGFDASVGMLLNAGSGAFAPERPIAPLTGIGPYLALADLDRNGRLDVVTANFTGGAMGVSVVLNQGGATFSAPASYATATGAFIEALAVADIDGDGLPDIAVADENACQIEVLFARCE